MLELDLGVEFELVCFCNSFKNRYTSKSPICADKFKTFLELALTDSPYFDSFSVVCDVFHLAVRKISGASAKRSIEEVDVSENRKMRPTPVMVASQSFQVCGPFVPPNLVFVPPPSAKASPRLPTFVNILPTPTPASASLLKPVPTPVAAPPPAHDVFLSTLASFTRPPTQPLPPGFISFDKNAPAQPELSALMGYEYGDDDAYPNFRRILKEASTHGHGGLVLFLTDALQDYLKMENTLKQLPEYMRLSEEEKARFDGMFKAIKGVRKEFTNNYLKKVVDEVIEAHKKDTDSESDSDSEDEVLKAFNYN